MCNFELAPEQFRQRRVEMLALAEQRHLARAMKPAMRPARARRARWARGSRAPVTSPVRLNPSPLFR